MNTKYTAGPWHVGVQQAHRIVYDTKGWAVCDCTVYHGKESADEMKANAALIAAAPELLHSLTRAVEALEFIPREHRPHGQDALVAAFKHVIAKAEGR